MGFFRNISETNRVARLTIELEDTEAKWYRLPENERQIIAERAKDLIDSLVPKVRGWGIERTQAEGVKLQRAAALQFDADPRSAFANWFSGAWLEATFSNVEEAGTVSGTIEGVLTGALTHLRVYWEPKYGVTTPLDFDDET